MYNKDSRKIEIVKCIQNNEPSCTFGVIKQHLKKTGESYKTNKGLSKTLDTLENNYKLVIKNSKSKPYPTYSTVQDYSIDTAIMGDTFRECYTSPFFSLQVDVNSDYLQKDIPINYGDSKDTKFIKSMVTRYGFYILAALIKSYEQSISRKNFDRKIWLSNAMDLMKDEMDGEDLLSGMFMGLLYSTFDTFEKDFDKESGLTKRKNKQLLKNKIKDLRNAMEETYPTLHKCVRLYDYGYERSPKKKRSRDIEKTIPNN